MQQIPLKAKYRPRGGHWAKKMKSGSNDSGHSRKKMKRPAPVARQRTLVLVEGRKRVWIG